ncbi:DUF4282 domain-containing protein [Stackebrandtia nassauensis]|uniref:DUF4282 domain-containing protein n=1 Tax=Stackebrandtia nassauensis (strain DSM 44728 / CIP 108903 / NRRL B-16338 / NBRC 102104 / LLR-40K-21) TaxID=446470 RepID=D3QA65_STANL|nr:DUF4282 domain-containing protein [Stackebrandtia nassauensis]ADD40777.1 hypothetical protein Snas_1067 [Stackebrandtia nassauensis DSM 44728]
MTYPQDPQQQPEQQGGYPQGHTEQPSGHYQQQPDPSHYPPPTGAYQSQPIGGTGKNFFASLFDFSFRSFVTPQVIQIYYVVALVVLGIGVVFGLISAVITIAEFDAFLGLVQLILVPIFGFVYLLLVRMGLELVSNFFRIGEDVKAMREKSDRTV